MMTHGTNDMAACATWNMWNGLACQNLTHAIWLLQLNLHMPSLKQYLKIGRKTSQRHMHMLDFKKFENRSRISVLYYIQHVIKCYKCILTCDKCGLVKEVVRYKYPCTCIVINRLIQQISEFRFEFRLSCEFPLSLQNLSLSRKCKCYLHQMGFPA